MKATVFLLLAIGLLASCVTSQGSAKAMYAAQYRCPKEQLTYENLGGYNVIMVRGCGFEQLYTCDHTATCVRDGERRPIAPAPGTDGTAAQPTTKP